MQILYFYLRRLTLCYYELYYKSWFLKNSKTDHSWTTPISSSSSRSPPEWSRWRQRVHLLAEAKLRINLQTTRVRHDEKRKIQNWQNEELTNQHSAFTIHKMLILLCTLIGFQLLWKHNHGKIAEKVNFHHLRASYIPMALPIKKSGWIHLPTQ